MRPYRIVAIIKEMVTTEEYSCAVVVIDDYKVYFTFKLPQGIPVNHGAIISFLVKKLKIAGSDIIWPETIVIPEI